MKTPLVWINAIALAAVLLVNYLSNALPLNDQTAGQISDRLAVLFTPAGYVFSIWGFIYLLLIIWVSLPFFRKYTGHPSVTQVGYWFAISSVFNILWLILFHYEQFEWTLVVMLGLLWSLIIIYGRLNDVMGRSYSRFVFSVYIGWISVATIVNVAIVLKTNLSSALFGLSPVVWTVIMLAVASVLAIWFMISKDDIVYPFVFVWAFIGIAVEQSEYPAILYMALAMAVLLALLAVTHVIRFRKWDS